MESGSSYYLVRGNPTNTSFWWWRMMSSVGNKQHTGGWWKVPRARDGERRLGDGQYAGITISVRWVSPRQRDDISVSNSRQISYNSIPHRSRINVQLLLLYLRWIQKVSNFRVDGFNFTSLTTFTTQIFLTIPHISGSWTFILVTITVKPHFIQVVPDSPTPHFLFTFIRFLTEKLSSGNFYLIKKDVVFSISCGNGGLWCFVKILKHKPLLGNASFSKTSLKHL